MGCFSGKLATFGTLALAVFLAGAEVADARAPTRIVGPVAQRGDKAVFRPPPAIAARVVDGDLLVGSHKTPLRPQQLRTIGRRGVLRVRVAPRARGVALLLRLAPTSNAPEPGGEIRPVAVAPAIPAPAPRNPAPDPLSGGRLYSPASPFNQLLPSDPAIAPDSSQLVQGLVKAQKQKGFVLTVDEWTVPTYFAGASTAVEDVSLGEAPPQWGMPSNSLAYPPGSSANMPWPLPTRLQGVPIPDSARPDPSLDAHLTIVDRAANCEYDLYGAHRSADGWHAVWANSTRLDGSGVYPFGMGAKASGFANLAGLIWPQELRSGHIDHALFFAYPSTKSGGPVSPATSSDGRLDGAGAMPEGARVQLDPSLDLDTLGLQPYQRTIAAALQTYGMILGDTGGALGLYAVGRQSFATDPYEGILPKEDFPDLSDIPADRFRVLELPAQQSQPHLQVAPSGCGSFG